MFGFGLGKVEIEVLYVVLFSIFNSFYGFIKKVFVWEICFNVMGRIVRWLLFLFEFDIMYVIKKEGW